MAIQVTSKRVRATTRAKGEAPEGEHDVIDATVLNRTQWRMRLTGSNLSWGKFRYSPTDVLAQNSMKFFAEGRLFSPSGTEGWAQWVLEGRTDVVTITAYFDNPYHGADQVSMTVDPPGIVVVSCVQSQGDHDYVDYFVAMPAS